MENNSLNKDQNKCCGVASKCCFSNPANALYVSGIIFAVVALIHLYRAVFYFPVTIGTTVIPDYVSVIVFLVFGWLSFWTLASACKLCKKD